MGPALEIGNSPEEDEWTDNAARRAPKRADVASGNDSGVDMH